MHSLRVTNVLLAIIAVCLVYLCLRLESVPAEAVATGQAPKAAEVRIVGMPAVRIEGVVQTEVTKGSLTVRGERSEPLPVMISNSDAIAVKGKYSDAVEVKVSTDNTVPVQIRDSHTIPVEVKNFPR